MQTLYRYTVDNEIDTEHICACVLWCVNLKSKGVCASMVLQPEEYQETAVFLISVEYLKITASSYYVASLFSNFCSGVKSNA
jgi:hypothetical protein